MFASGDFQTGTSVGIIKGRNGRDDEPSRRSLPLEIGYWTLAVGYSGRKIMGRKIGRDEWVSGRRVGDNARDANGAMINRVTALFPLEIGCSG